MIDQIPCAICGEPAFCMGGKKGLRPIPVCDDCFGVTNGELTIKGLRNENESLKKEIGQLRFCLSKDVQVIAERVIAKPIAEAITRYIVEHPPTEEIAEAVKALKEAKR